jgi:hypothetical protein
VSFVVVFSFLPLCKAELDEATSVKQQRIVESRHGGGHNFLCVHGLIGYMHSPKPRDETPLPRCLTRIASVLSVLPSDVAAAYPVLPRYASGQFHLHTDVSDDVDLLMKTYANGTYQFGWRSCCLRRSAAKSYCTDDGIPTYRKKLLRVGAIASPNILAFSSQPDRHMGSTSSL